MAAPPASAQTALGVSLQSGNFNGYQVKCFGKQTGQINATVSGGTAPYQYSWSNGAATEDLTALAAGYYKLTVTDADSAVAVADITLTEPTPLVVVAEPYTWPNGFNVSCPDCYNGSIEVSVGQGVPPYSYLWNDSATTTQDRSGLGGRKYFVVVTDANNCWVKSETVLLTQPERSVWDRGGNANTDPAVQYLGTSDSNDVVFKSNGAERLRIRADGSIGLLGADTTFGPLYRDLDGTLKAGGGPVFPDFPINPDFACLPMNAIPFWKSIGNAFNPCPNDPYPKLGTLNAYDLNIITNNVTRLFISSDGRVGIGTYPPDGPPSTYRLYVEDGISTRDVLIKHGTWNDHVFHVGYALMPLDELRAFLRRHRHLPGIPSAREVLAKGGMEVGDMQRRLLKTVEEQALYILQLEEKQALLERRLEALEHQRR
ncbi:MAG: SprB repeat-containing protein [Flavobacteriales bacterium]|nr:SprB repeat-containing protein [Flavobacteriales bacterium]MBP9079960.1 SprB repeat-containing protein [Flavobacteriales bacterium]